jgi:hypothetical protein
MSEEEVGHVSEPCEMLLMLSGKKNVLYGVLGDQINEVILPEGVRFLLTNSLAVDSKMKH